jgi:hypothetical protein
MKQVTAGKQQKKAIRHNGVRGIFHAIISHNSFKIVFQMTYADLEGARFKSQSENSLWWFKRFVILVTLFCTLKQTTTASC